MGSVASTTGYTGTNNSCSVIITTIRDMLCILTGSFHRTPAVLLLLGVVLSVQGYPGQYEDLSDNSEQGGPCKDSETSCILRHLLSQGLISGDHQARSNVVGEEDTDNLTEDLLVPTEQRSQRNSKYRPDCWEEEGEEVQGRSARGRRRGRGRGGRRRTAPCLWETGYYMGDSVET